jgi:integrase
MVIAVLTDADLLKARRDVKATGKTKTLTDPGLRGDGRLLVVTRPMPNGPLVEFYARQIVGNTRRTAKLGTYPMMTLAAARKAFAALSPAIRDGENVRARRDKARQEIQALGTLLDVCEGYASSLENAKRRSGPEVRRCLIVAPDSACKVIGGYRPARDITPSDIAAWLRPKHPRAPVAAKQSRAWLSAAYTWALRREHDYTIDQPHRWGITDNPAARVPAHTVAQRGGTRHLSREEFRRVWSWLASEGGRTDQRACNALRVMMATGQRVEEILYLRAGQYDGAWLRWEETKIENRPHSIPVPVQARVILDAMEPSRHGLYVPGMKYPHEPYQSRSLIWIGRRCSRQLGIPQFTPRDLRRTWRSLAGNVGLNAEECARIMNHAWGPKVEADHYDKGENAAIKVAAMAKWEKALAAILQPEKSEAEPNASKRSRADTVRNVRRHRPG